MRAALKARGVDLLERPSLPDPSQVLASKELQAAAAHLPDGERGPAFGYPSSKDVQLYSLKVGSFSGATDADARWALRILREHPDGGARINAVGCLTSCLSDGYSWELERSLVSPNLRSEVLIELLTLVITTPKTQLDSLLQRVVVNDFGTTCLWRIPAVRDAIEAYYAQHADNQEPLFLRLKEGTLQMMRSTPRGKAYGEK